MEFLSGSCTMDPIHREVLENNHTHLVESLRAADVTDHLLSENAINKYDYEQLKRTEAQGPRAVNRLLLLTLRRRGVNAYPSFQRALRVSGQGALCDILLDNELNLKEGLATERMERNPASSSFSHNSGFNGLHLDQQADVLSRSWEPLSSSRVLRRTNSPAYGDYSSPIDRLDKGPPSSQRSHRSVTTSSPEPSSREQALERESQFQRLQQEVLELRKSHIRMAMELREQMEQLEKDKAAEKRGGGCAVM